MGYASDKMGEAAAASGEAATASGQLAASSEAILGKLGEVIQMVAELRNGHATVGGLQEAGRAAAIESRTTMEAAVGPSEFSAMIGAWAHMAHEGSHLQPADSIAEKIIGVVSGLIVNECAELGSLYAQEQDRHSERQGQALRFISG